MTLSKMGFIKNSKRARDKKNLNKRIKIKKKIFLKFQKSLKMFLLKKLIQK